MENFSLALVDYRYLREKRYPEKAALKLVGDKHRLTRVERNTLFRGVIPEQTAAGRRQKLLSSESLRGKSLGIDWYNVLITVESFLRGFPLFLSDDGITRDSSSTHGSYRRTTITEQALNAICETLREISPGRIDSFLDSPIAFSGLMAEEARSRLTDLGIPVFVALEHTADFPLKSYEGVVASSDSVILDCAHEVFDLPRCVAQARFHFTPPSLAMLPVSFPKVFGQSSWIENLER